MVKLKEGYISCSFTMELKNRDKMRCKSIPATASSSSLVPVLLALKENAIKKRRFCVYMKCLFAAVGMFFMVLEGELFISNTIQKYTLTSDALKTLISISTAILIVFIIVQYVYQKKIERFSNRSRNLRCCAGIIVEIVVCVVHPFPGSGRIPKPLQTISKESAELTRDFVYLDAYLSLFMIFRFYLFGQVTSEWLSSKLYSNRTLAKHLAFLTKVRLNSTFMMKYLLFRYPFQFVSTILFLVLIVNSFAMQTCEAYTFPGSEMGSFLNALWLVIITFLTIGYGDFYPVSFCGRCVSAATGFLGIGITGFIFSVFVHHFEMNRDEKYLLKFSKDERLKFNRRVAASNVIKFYYMAAKHRDEKAKYLVWRERFWKAVHVMRRSTKKYGNYSDIDLIDIQQMIQNVEKRQNEILSVLGELGKSMKSDQNANTGDVFDSAM